MPNERYYCLSNISFLQFQHLTVDNDANIPRHISKYINTQHTSNTIGKTGKYSVNPSCNSPPPPPSPIQEGMNSPSSLPPILPTPASPPSHPPGFSPCLKRSICPKVIYKQCSYKQLASEDSRANASSLLRSSKDCDIII